MIPHYREKVLISFLCLIIKGTLQTAPDNMLIKRIIKNLITSQSLSHKSSVQLGNQLRAFVPIPEITIAQTILDMFHIFSEYYTFNETISSEFKHITIPPTASCSSAMLAIVYFNDIHIKNYHGNHLATIEHPFNGYAIDILSLAPDNSLIIAHGTKQGEGSPICPFINTKNELQVWQLYKPSSTSTLETIHIISLNECATTVTFSPDSKFLAIGSPCGMIKVYNALTWQKILSSYSFNNKKITTLAFSPDNQMLASADEENHVTIRYLENPHRTMSLYCNRNLSSQSLKFNAQKELCITYEENGRTYIEKWIPLDREMLLELSLAQLILTLKFHRKCNLLQTKLKHQEDKQIYTTLPSDLLAAIEKTRIN